MTENSLIWNFIARDRASSVISSLGERVGGLGRTIALGFGGAAVGGVVAFGAALVQGVKDAQDYQTLQLKTGAVLRSTGNAAHVTISDIQGLASSLETMSGVDETLIINSENVLATFTGIRNEVGKGNDIFTRATGAALDMSVALGQDLQSSTIQLGKALNDPIKGIGALSKVGVSFTEQQKEQIKTLVKSGDTLGAQKVILKELNTEFGGAAKAAGEGFAGSIARVKDVVGDFFRTLGMDLLPVLTTVANVLAENLPKAATFLSDAFGKLSPVFSTIGNAITGFSDGADKSGKALTKLNEPMQIISSLASGVRVVFLALRQAVGDVASWFMDKLVPAIKTMAESLLPSIKAAITSVTQTFKEHQDIIVYVKQAFQVLGNFIVQYLVPALGVILKEAISAIGPAFRIVADIISNVVIPTVRFLATLFQEAMQKIQAAIVVVTKYFNDHKEIVQSVKVAYAILQVFIQDVLIPIFIAVKNMLVTEFSVAFKAAGIVVGSLANIFTTQVMPVLSFFKDVVQNIVIPVIKTMVSQFIAGFGFIVSAAATAFGWVPGLGGKLQGAAAAFNRFKSDVNNAISGIISHKVVSVSVLVNGKAGSVIDVGGGVYNINVGGVTQRAFDDGGWLMPGYTQTYNGTGQPEAIFTQDQLRNFSMGKGGASIVFQNSGPLIGNNVDDWMAEKIDYLKRRKRI